MDLALMIARSGLEAHHKNIEIISNNLANANTTSFKRNRGEFADLPYQVDKQPGSPIVEGETTTSGLIIGTGTKLVNNQKIYTDGPQITTNEQNNIMINGRGFLQVQLPNSSEMAYTRAGTLTTNEQGQLTTLSGYIIQPPITIPQGTQSINISKDGFISVTSNGSNLEQQIGQIQLADFMNTEGLQPVGENLYLSTTSSGAAILGNPMQDSYGSIVQGALEGSNVNVVEEMVNLIEAQRAFEVTSKAVSAVDNMLQYLDNVT